MHSPRLLLTALLALGLVACGDNAARLPPRINVTPAAPTLAVGDSVDVAAQYLDAAGDPSPAGDVTWTISDSTIASIAALADGHVKVTAVKVGGATLTVTGSGVTRAIPVTVTAAVLRKIEVTPSAPSVAAGTTVQLTATGTYSDSTTRNLTTMVTWASAATAIGTVSTAGVFKGLKIGTAKITATLTGVSGSVTATVTAANLLSIAITPPTPSLAAGTTQQLTATGSFSDSTTQDLTAQVTWASATTATATVSAGGLVTAVALGTSQVTATLGTVSGATTVTVTAALLASIAVTPPTPSLALGRTLQLTATGTFTDRSTQDLTAQVTWASAATGKATVSATGLVTSVAPGDAPITATLGAISGSTTVTVTAAVLDSIAIDPPTPSVAKGLTLQLTATGTFSDATTQDLTNQVTWGTSDGNVVQVSNAAGTQGLASGLNVGTATVTAISAGVTGTVTFTVSQAQLVSIGVTPATRTLTAGLTLQYTATGTFTDTTTQDLTGQVTWSSSNTAIATISNAVADAGLATAVAQGSTTITATLQGKSGTATLTVTTAALVSIEVTPTNPSLALGRTQPFIATGTFTDSTTSDLTTQVTWASSDLAVASISNAVGSEGQAKALAVGTTTISASLSGKTGSTTLTVTDAVLDTIAITPAAPSAAKGRTLQLAATGTFSDLTTQDLTTQVTWASSDTAIATVSNAAPQGLVSTVAVGTTTISATLSGKTGTATFTVTSAVLDSIAVTPTTTSIAKGRQQQYTATGTFSDLSTQDITTQVVWASSNTTIASISNAAGSQGLATTLALGTVTISAAASGQTGNATLTVTNAVLDSVAVTPTTATVIVGGKQQYTATGTFSDGSTLDLTATALWASADTAVATVSNAAGSIGQATGVAIGTTTVTATSTGVSGSAQIVVAAGSLCATSLVISQVYGGGGNGGAPIRNDFIELHNAGATAVNLSGLAIQFTSATGPTTPPAWAVQPLPAVSVPAGGYFLIQEASNAAVGAPLPTPDFVPAAPLPVFAMGATSGKVALTPNTTPLTAANPTGQTLDLVGYGTTANGFEGTGPTPAPSNTTSVDRGNAGCTDRNDNKTDFTAGPPAPRNGATAVNVCGAICPLPPPAATASYLDDVR